MNRKDQKNQDRQQKVNQAHAEATAKVDALLARIQQGLEAKRAAQAGETKHWGHVGDEAYIAEQLQEISDRLFGEGEYAE